MRGARNLEHVTFSGLTDPASLPSRIQRQQAALLELGRGWRRYEADLGAAIRAITETAVTALNVERASVWLFDEAHSLIRCEDLFEVSKREHSGGTELAGKDFPHYFDALESEEVIAAEDAHHDPRTREFSESYLSPLGIGAMLDAPIRSGGRVVGVLCHEHIGAERSFGIDEQNVATYLASLVSLALEFRRRNEIEAELDRSLSLLRAAFEATGEGILAVDMQGSVVTHNHRFLEIWTIPNELLGSAGDGGARLDALAAMTTDPAGFVARARSISADTESESLDLIELRDGRRVERTSRPQKMEGKTIGRVWSYRDVTHLKRVEEALRESETRLRELASRDALTGLLNRRSIYERLEEEVRRSNRNGQPFSIAMLDLDHFKLINDERGHQIGDEVLRAFATDLGHRVRRTDAVGRAGGEEFLLILLDSTREPALRMVDGIRRYMSRQRGDLPSFTVSGGVAEFPIDGGDSAALIAVADRRLYAAKHAGRNRIL